MIDLFGVAAGRGKVVAAAIANPGLAGCGNAAKGAGLLKTWAGWVSRGMAAACYRR